MNDWKVIPTIVLSTVLIFGAGVFTGGFLVNYVKPAHANGNGSGKKNVRTETPLASNTVSNSTAKPNARLPEVLSKPFLPLLDDKLHLTPDEHEAIQKIINDGQNQMRKVVQDTRLEIREVLTPDQRKQFDELVKRPFHKPVFGTNAPVLTPSATNAPAGAL